MGFCKVIKPGLFTTIQDRGRFGYQQSGMPVAGAMDEFALRVGNILVGNPEGESCLEITLLGPTLEFLSQGLIALTGGDLGAQLNGKELPLWEACEVKAGDILKFTGVKKGCRAYLAVAGGFNAPAVMGSKATYVRGTIGGLEGRTLREGDILEKGPSNSAGLAGRKVPQDDIYTLSNHITLRVVLGPQAEAFTAEGINTFLTSSYTVTNEADRMGYRLEGEKIQHQKGADIISDGIVMGSVQVPGHGMPIVMMADRQTTGGYTKIATVITPDLPLLAQAKPGDKVSFRSVSIDEAHSIYRIYEEKIAALKRTLRSSVPQDKSSVPKGPKRTLKLLVNGKEYLVDVEEVQ
ncbi:5-oxoprolinase/urea amidolyase family protein [Thermanaerosceptrum fracticalcis]|uniref:5-oxoprolinase/urea amidolyase family protein n=1 Tax=Thermanaerosceptrum fracticalcis TaxID=1712410 RepID=A0A7G6E406_THEFR|nr:biotin-dependent carboxyltransferase family protein [Thermanaerosceptrum fracticalcis]QNB46810.1 5-oxoprolinase/urea amidolyase family protein [Thermanaerosceptrum fracticalcis]